MSSIQTGAVDGKCFYLSPSEISRMARHSLFRCLYYETFYGRNLRIFCNELECFFPGKPLQSILMFAGKAGAYPRVDHLKGASLARDKHLLIIKIRKLWP